MIRDHNDLTRFNAEMRRIEELTSSLPELEAIARLKALSKLAECMTTAQLTDLAQHLRKIAS